jgi:hypothetical protein
MRVPPTLPPELQQALRELWSAMDRVMGPRNIDFHGRKLLNAGASVAGREYITRAELDEILGVSAESTATSAAGGGGTTGPGSITGTHAERLVAAKVKGLQFYETDRTTTYIVNEVAGVLTWHYHSGVMVGLDGGWPTDLIATDVGFRYDATDVLKGYRWTGTVWEFWVPLDPPTTSPATPNSPVPATGMTGVSINPTLVWVSANATTYDVYFGASSPPALVSSGQAGATYTPAGPLTTATPYYWQIKAINVHGNSTGSIWSFTTEAAGLTAPGTPATPSPADGATGVTRLPRLTWASARATNYTIFFGNGLFNFVANWENPNGDVDDDYGLANYTMPDERDLLTPSDRIGPAWSTCPDEGDDGWLTDVGAQTAPAVAMTGLGTAAWSAPRLAPSLPYLWKIRASNAAGSADGPEWDFTTAAAAGAVPSAPATPSPANGATGVPTAVSLTWTADGATSCEFWGLSTTASPVYSTTVSVNTVYAPTLAGGTTYYWKIVATNAFGNTVGSVWSFTTASAAPADPSIPSPSDTAVDVAVDANLTWAASARADWYTIALATTYPPALYPSSADPLKLYTPTFNPPENLTPSTRYYWYVQAWNASGRATGSVWSFVTAAAVTPPGTLPTKPTGHTLTIDGYNFRTVSNNQLWRWQGCTYFGMLYDYLNATLPAGLYDWARGVGINVFRVLTMKCGPPQVRGTGFPWAPFTPSDYTDNQLGAFLTAVEAEGFYVQLVALADTQAYTATQTGGVAWDGLPTRALKQAHLDRIANVAKTHTKTFVEEANEPELNGVSQDDMLAMTCNAGVWVCKGSGSEPYPYKPAWHYGTEHSNRSTYEINGIDEWPRKAKNLREYEREGGEGDHQDTFPPFNIPFIGNEPMGMDEAANIAVSLNGSERSNDPQLHADYAAVAAIIASGSTIHSQCLGLEGTLPTAGSDQERCIAAIAEVWAELPVDVKSGSYTAGHLSTCPLIHDTTTAMKIYGTYSGNEAWVVVVGRTSSYVEQPRAGWEVVGHYGYNDHIVKCRKV